MSKKQIQLLDESVPITYEENKKKNTKKLKDDFMFSGNKITDEKKTIIKSK